MSLFGIIITQLIITVLALKYEFELNCQEKSKFVNSSQNEGLSPSGTALSFVRLGSISWHSLWFPQAQLYPLTDWAQFHGTLSGFLPTAL
jgi:hypothetical protein